MLGRGVGAAFLGYLFVAAAFRSRLFVGIFSRMPMHERLCTNAFSWMPFRKRLFVDAFSRMSYRGRLFINALLRHFFRFSVGMGHYYFEIRDVS